MTVRLTKVDPIHPDPCAIDDAADILRHGGVVAFPTETVYGLAADAFNKGAVNRVYEVKGRPESKPLPVQVANICDVARLSAELPDGARKLINKFFPGPLTIILRASDQVPEIVTAGTGKVGIRMPDHPVALAMIHAAGTPIVAPSANTSGDPPPTSAEEVQAYFDTTIDMILDGGPSRIRMSSTVVDVSDGALTIIRQGSISEEEIRDCLAG